MALIKRLQRVFDELFYHDKWNIGYVYQSPESLIHSQKLTGKIHWLREDGADYAADPFSVEIDDRTYIYYEELQFFKGKGEIIMIDGFTFKNKRKVQGIVTDNFHLSYPYIFTLHNDLYCMPESAATKQVNLYKIDKTAPWKLNKVRTLIEGEPFVDSSIIFYHNRYWLFTSMSGKSDQLFIFYADSLHSNFKAHALNPIHVEPKITRSAGNLFIVDDNLYRPSQNPEKDYGGSIIISQIARITENEFEYSKAFEILPQLPYGLGLHTINFSGQLIVIDGKRKVFNLLSVIKKMFKKMKRR